MTPYTSILALDSEAAYARQGIVRRASRLRGVKLTALDPTEERALTRRYAGLERGRGLREQGGPATGSALRAAPPR